MNNSTACQQLTVLGVLPLLELSEDDQTEIVAFGEPPNEQVGDGAGRGRTTALALSMVAAQSDDVPVPLKPPVVETARSRDVPPLSLTGTNLPVDVRHYQADSGIVVLRKVRCAFRPLAGTVEYHDRDGDLAVVLDGRKAPAIVQLCAGGHERILVNHRGVVTVYAIYRVVSFKQTEQDVSSGETVNLAGVAPSPTEFLADRPSEPWLLQAVQERAESAWILHRIASAGMIARFWTPADQASRKRTLPDLGNTPAARVYRWAAALPPDVAQAIEDAAIREAHALNETLEAYSETEADDLAVYALLLRRDDLESAADVLERTASHSELRAVLDDLDRRALSSLSTLPAGEDIAQDPQLLAASWTDPLAWWTTVALG